jgi:hypothetical protein
VHVSVFEEHSSVLAEWWRLGFRGRTVVYLDAHLDLQHAGAQRVAALGACSSAEQVAALEKPHPLLPDARYSYSLEDFLYPAAALGWVRRLVWVAPPHVHARDPRKALRELQQMDGVRPEDLASFRRTPGGWLEGRLLGLDLVMCEYRQLADIPLAADSAIDIDIDYFVTVPGDEAWIHPHEVFDVLQGLPLSPPLVSISRSVGSGFTPLRYRFFADLLAALFEGREQDAAHFDRLCTLQQALRRGEREKVLAALQTEHARHPGCAATCHLLSEAATETGETARWTSQAAALDPGYRPSVLRDACELRHRRLPARLSRVMELERKAASITPADDERTLVWLALGMLYCAFGQATRAVAYYERCRASGSDQPQLALEIGRLFVNTEPDRARTFLGQALADDKTRTAAQLALAMLAVEDGLHDEARDRLARVCEWAPAWSEPRAMLAKLLEQGETGQGVGNRD